MKKWHKTTLSVVGNLLVIAFAGLAVLTRDQALKQVRNPLESRQPTSESPADYGLAYEDVSVTTADGLKLVGWYVPSQNCAAIIAVHGYRGNRANLLPTAAILQRHGYGVLIGSFRAHDLSEGELITLGKDHKQDFEAWYQYLLTRADVDPTKIGLLGESLGGALAIDYAAQNPNIQALVLDSAPARFNETLVIAIHRYCVLPAFPVAPMLIFWAERETGVDSSQIQPMVWIKEISPHPVLILQGGADEYISDDSGEALYQAARDPKELLYLPGATHHGLDEEPFCAVFEQRVVGFFDRYLLGR